MRCERVGCSCDHRKIIFFRSKQRIAASLCLACIQASRTHHQQQQYRHTVYLWATLPGTDFKQHAQTPCDHSKMVQPLASPMCPSPLAESLSCLTCVCVTQHQLLCISRTTPVFIGVEASNHLTVSQTTQCPHKSVQLHRHVVNLPPPAVPKVLTKATKSTPTFVQPICMSPQSVANP